MMEQTLRRGVVSLGLLAGVIALGALGAVAAAADGCRNFAGGGPCGGCVGNCPDNYCPKPIPCFRLPATCGRCDDYCPKPEPCFRLPATCGCCDDYCPKPAPCVTKPCGWPPFYKCPPPLRGGPCGPVGRSDGPPCGLPCK